MSIFKEKDDDFKKILKSHLNLDDDSSESEHDEAISQSPKTSNQDEEALEHENNRLVPSPNKRTKIEIKSLDNAEKEVELISCSPNDEIVDCTGEDDEVITIDSDEDDVKETSLYKTQELATQEEYSSIDLNVTDTDDYFNLKMTIAGQYKQFKTTYNTPLFETLQELLADLKNQNKSLVLTLRDVPIDLSQSPKSIGLDVGTILRGTPVLGATEDAPSVPMETSLDPDEITLKVQDGNLRHTKEFRIKKDAQFISLKENYARQFNIEDTEKLTLMFDGDEIADNETPESLDIEDGFMIDIKIKS